MTAVFIRRWRISAADRRTFGLIERPPAGPFRRPREDPAFRTNLEGDRNPRALSPYAGRPAATLAGWTIPSTLPSLSLNQAALDRPASAMLSLVRSPGLSYSSTFTPLHFRSCTSATLSSPRKAICVGVRDG